jgi:hypothetical protein
VAEPNPSDREVRAWRRAARLPRPDNGIRRPEAVRKVTRSTSEAWGPSDDEVTHPARGGHGAPLLLFTVVPFGPRTTSWASVLPTWARVGTPAVEVPRARWTTSNVNWPAPKAVTMSRPAHRRVGLVVTPAAHRDQQIQVEVRSALRALHDVMHIQATPHATRLTAPAGAAQDLRSDGLR